MQKRTALRRFFFAVVYPGGGFKRRGPEPTSACMQGPPLNTRRGRRPRRPPKRHPVGVPFCYSSSEGAKLSLAVRPGITKRKKRSTRWAGSIYIPALAGGIYLSPAAAGDIYFVRADRRGLIKHKKRYTPQKNNLYYSSRGSGRDIYLSPAAAGDIYFVRAVSRGLIKHKKRRTKKQIKLYYPWPLGQG